MSPGKETGSRHITVLLEEMCHSLGTSTFAARAGMGMASVRRGVDARWPRAESPLNLAFSPGHCKYCSFMSGHETNKMILRCGCGVTRSLHAEDEHISLFRNAQDEAAG